MGTTVIFQDTFRLDRDRADTLKDAEMKWLREQLAHARELTERIVADLQKGVDVKIVGPDGNSVVAVATPDWLNAMKDDA